MPGIGIGISQMFRKVSNVTPSPPGDGEVLSNEEDEMLTTNEDELLLTINEI